MSATSLINTHELHMVIILIWEIPDITREAPARWMR